MGVYGRMGGRNQLTWVQVQVISLPLAVPDRGSRDFECPFGGSRPDLTLFASQCFFHIYSIPSPRSCCRPRAEGSGRIPSIADWRAPTYLPRTSRAVFHSWICQMTPAPSLWSTRPSHRASKATVIIRVPPSAKQQQ